MTYSLCIFDLDGTLIDTSRGIISSCNNAAKSLSRPMQSESSILSMIGSPVYDIFRNGYAMDEKTANHAVLLFRKNYDLSGIHQVRVYDGIMNILTMLKNHGCFTAVVTMKPTNSATAMLTEFRLISSIDFILGKGDNKDLTKAMMIQKCMERYNINAEKTLMIGDSDYDRQGAQDAGVDFIGVAYGFGFSNTADVLGGYHTFGVDSVPELGELLEKVIPLR